MRRIGYHKQVSARGSSWKDFMKHLSICFHLRRLGSNMTTRVAIMFNNNAVAHTHKKQVRCALAIRAQYILQYHKIQPPLTLIAELSLNALRVDS